MLGILIALAAVVLLAAFLIAPSPKRRAVQWKGTAFAHRGLHGRGITENTLEAFEKACHAGVGIELDVQLSKDGEVVVFHDDDLKRMVGDERHVDQVDLAELRKMELVGGGGISTFAEVLKCVNGRVPLLVEIKTGKRNAELCEKTMALLAAYRGAYVVESFNPLILRWLKKHAPAVVRGQLVGERASYLASQTPTVALLLSMLALNFLARPDFVAYDVSAKEFSAPRIQRALFHTPMAAWTVRDEETFRACIERGEMPIFEHLDRFYE